MQFWLGTHLPGWLWDGRVGDAGLFVSRRRLSSYRRLRPATTDWILDSGGFSELTLHGRWTVTPAEYVREVRRYQLEIGRLRTAVICDWMCEPFVLARTGLTIAEHQERTVDSYGELLALAPGVPWLPVLQGWATGDYLAHLEQYDRAGFDLRTLPLVGVGSVCRRQHTDGAAQLLARLSQEGLRLHGFGLKLQGLMKAAGALASADSMAWSFDARRSGGAWCGSTTHANCANCLPYALHWRERVVTMLTRRGVSRQLALAV
jgi:hypothetical protein